MNTGNGSRAHEGPLRLRTVPADPAAAVVLLHGGRADALTAPTRLDLPAVRMLPFARAITRRVLPGKLLIADVRYRHRGWNGARADAARDAREALDELTELHPTVPMVLVGHSMGGRAALRAADHPQVRGVVGLAPWCPPGEPAAHLTGRQVIVLHDENDTVTDAHGSWDLLQRAHRSGAMTCGIAMPEGRHAMLRGAADWHRITAAAVEGILWPQTMPRAVAAAQAGPVGIVVPAHDVIPA
ncbi:alpha/beta fold hydrolase [Streptomyces sp. NPDC002779]|uniref:alpha/beta fold hydrolase n=1 Tax=Streptomyces sp. NPDC002779 TaxID=3364664 RepID=UPI003692CE58